MIEREEEEEGEKKEKSRKRGKEGILCWDRCGGKPTAINKNNK